MTLIYLNILNIFLQNPQLDNLNDEKELGKYLPWSDALPTELKNVDSEVLKVNKSLLSK